MTGDLHLVGPGARGAAGLGPAGDRPAGWDRTRAAARRCRTASHARLRTRVRNEWPADAGGGSEHELRTRRWGSSCTTCTAAGAASSGGRGSWVHVILCESRGLVAAAQPALNLCAHERATAEPQSAVVEYEYRQTPSCASAALECTSGLASTAQRSGRREFVRGLVPVNAVVMLVMPNAERCLAIARRAASRVRAPEFLSMTFRELLPRT